MALLQNFSDYVLKKSIIVFGIPLMEIETKIIFFKRKTLNYRLFLRLPEVIKATPVDLHFHSNILYHMDVLK